MDTHCVASISDASKRISIFFDGICQPAVPVQPNRAKFGQIGSTGWLGSKILFCPYYKQGKIKGITRMGAFLKKVDTHCVASISDAS